MDARHEPLSQAEALSGYLLASEPELDALRRRHPAWHAYYSAAGLWLARRLAATPVALVRAETLSDLDAMITAYESDHGPTPSQRGPWQRQ